MAESTFFPEALSIADGAKPASVFQPPQAAPEPIDFFYSFYEGEWFDLDGGSNTTVESTSRQLKRPLEVEGFTPDQRPRQDQDQALPGAFFDPAWSDSVFSHPDYGASLQQGSQELLSWALLAPEEKKVGNVGKRTKKMKTEEEKTVDNIITSTERAMFAEMIDSNFFPDFPTTVVQQHLSISGARHAERQPGIKVPNRMFFFSF